jgi:hypothetical protein
MAIETLKTFADLIEYLTERNVPHRGDLASQVVELPVRSPPLVGHIYVRWEKTLPFLQVIHPFVTNVPAERVPEVETAICRANTIIPLPGLGYEHERRFVYMRLCMPIFQEGMVALSFQRLVRALIQNAKDFIGAFRDIVAGKPGAEVMALAIKHRNEHDLAAQTVPKP